MTWVITEFDWVEIYKIIYFWWFVVASDLYSIMIYQILKEISRSKSHFVNLNIISLDDLHLKIS